MASRSASRRQGRRYAALHRGTYSLSSPISSSPTHVPLPRRSTMRTGCSRSPNTLRHRPRKHRTRSIRRSLRRIRLPDQSLATRRRLTGRRAGKSRLAHRMLRCQRRRLRRSYREHTLRRCQSPRMSLSSPPLRPRLHRRMPCRENLQVPGSSRCRRIHPNPAQTILFSMASVRNHRHDRDSRRCRRMLRQQGSHRALDNPPCLTMDPPQSLLGPDNRRCRTTDVPGNLLVLGTLPCLTTVPPRSLLARDSPLCQTIAAALDPLDLGGQLCQMIDVTRDLRVPDNQLYTTTGLPRHLLGQDCLHYLTIDGRRNLLGRGMRLWRMRNRTPHQRRRQDLDMPPCQVTLARRHPQRRDSPLWRRTAPPRSLRGLETLPCPMTYPARNRQDRASLRCRTIIVPPRSHRGLDTRPCPTSHRARSHLGRVSRLCLTSTCLQAESPLVHASLLSLKNTWLRAGSLLVLASRPRPLIAQTSFVNLQAHAMRRFPMSTFTLRDYHNQTRMVIIMRLSPHLAHRLSLHTPIRITMRRARQGQTLVIISALDSTSFVASKFTLHYGSCDDHFSLHSHSSKNATSNGRESSFSDYVHVDLSDIPLSPTPKPVPPHHFSSAPPHSHSYRPPPPSHHRDRLHDEHDRYHDHRRTRSAYSPGDRHTKEWVFTLDCTLEELYRGTKQRYRISQPYPDKRATDTVDINIPPGTLPGTRVPISLPSQRLTFVINELPHLHFIRVRSHSPAHSYDFHEPPVTTLSETPNTSPHLAMCVEMPYSFLEDSYPAVRGPPGSISFAGPSGAMLRVMLPRTLVEASDGTCVRGQGMPIYDSNARRVVGYGDLFIRCVAFTGVPSRRRC